MPLRLKEQKNKVSDFVGGGEHRKAKEKIRKKNKGAS
jgi:hypothetical protein